MRKLITHLFVSAIAYCGWATIAAACGCSGATGFSMTVDANETTVTAVATYYSYPNCDASIEAVVTAPDSTTASAWDSTGPGGVGQQLTATAQYTVGAQDGTYYGVGHYDYCDNSTSTCGSWPDQNQVQTVAKFVKLTNTTETKTSMHFQNDSVGFTVSVFASNNCGGQIQVANGLSGLNGDFSNITNTPDMGVAGNAVAYSTKTIAGGGTQNYNFTVATGAGNTGTGTMVMGGYLNSIPNGCTPLGPDSGGTPPRTASQNVAVTNP
jgi:hypothetical protein